MAFPTETFTHKIFAPFTSSRIKEFSSDESTISLNSSINLFPFITLPPKFSDHIKRTPAFTSVLLDFNYLFYNKNVSLLPLTASTPQISASTALKHFRTRYYPYQP